MTKRSKISYVPELNLLNIDQYFDPNAPQAPREPEPAGASGVTPTAMQAGGANNLTEHHTDQNIGIAGLNVLTQGHSN